jgi:hypothetical protein
MSYPYTIYFGNAIHLPTIILHFVINRPCTNVSIRPSASRNIVCMIGFRIAFIMMMRNIIQSITLVHQNDLRITSIVRQQTNVFLVALSAMESVIANNMAYMMMSCVKMKMSISISLEEIFHFRQFVMVSLNYTWYKRRREKRNRRNRM